MSKKQEFDVDGRRITVSNLDKVLFPSGFMKAQVIDYYVRVAPFLLPHLRDRPVTLKRYPDGVGAKHFYEKNAPRFTPDWVRTFPVPRRDGGRINYILIDDLATLAWCANLANLEIHPFLHCAPRIDTPSYVVFDLDPGEGTDILTCAEVAMQLREDLKKRKLESFAKVSGSKGIQIYVPLNTPVTYAASQPFARRLAEQMEREHPDLVISEMAKVARTGKVFIDWSQNSDFKTTAGVYSLRAKSERPYISMPVSWQELSAAMKKGSSEGLYFEPEAALARLKKKGDLFAPVLELKQTLAEDVPAQPARASGVAHRGHAMAAGAALAPARGELGRLPRAEAKFFPPMQARAVENLPEGSKWQYEIKLDGYRALAARAHSGLLLLSRNNNTLNDRFPQVARALGALPEDTVLDGEIVALDGKGRPSFNALQNSHTTDRPIFFYVFDLPVYRGRDLKGLPLAERRRLLEEEAFAGLPEPVRLSGLLHAGAADLVSAAKEQGFEGLIAKRTDSLYESGQRTGSWVKLRVNKGQELVIGGYIPGTTYFDSLLVGYYDGPRLIFIAKIRNGFVPRLREEVAQRFRGLGTNTCPFANLPEPKNARRGEALTAEGMKKCCWLKPELVAQIEYTDWTAADHLRHSRFVALRDDKQAREVVKEA